MISILETIQSRVPTLSVTDEESLTTILSKVLLGGDQFSTAMARRVIAERKNSTDMFKGLEAIIPVAENWHTELCLLTV